MIKMVNALRLCEKIGGYGTVLSSHTNARERKLMRGDKCIEIVINGDVSNLFCALTVAIKVNGRRPVCGEALGRHGNRKRYSAEMKEMRR